MLTWQNTGDPCAPETLTSVNHLCPTRVGYTTGLGPVAFSTLSSPTVNNTADVNYLPRGMSYLDASGNQKFLFTLPTKVYLFEGGVSGAAITDVTRAAPYTAGLIFNFALFRDVVYAVNGSDLLQKSTGGAFTDVATTPKLSRICTWGDRMFGIGNVASFTSGGTPYAASQFRYWISGIGNPEQFDAAIDSTAYTQDILDEGGPLTACVVLRDFVVMFKKSAVYVIEATGNPADPYVRRVVSNYYGCAWPDSIIEINNVLYWISPTRSGEVCAFDGAQITVLSGALKSTIIDQRGIDYEDGFFTGSVVGNQTGITVATDGETIYWSSLLLTIMTSAATKQLCMNIATGRFGYSDKLTGTNSPMMVASNATQDAMMCVYPSSISLSNHNFKVGHIKRQDSLTGTAEFYRGNGKDFFVPKTATLRFSEYTDANLVDTQITTNFPSNSAAATPAYSGTPTLKIASTKNSGDAVTKTEASVISPITASWNATTSAFDISQTGHRSTSARTFAFLMTVTPKNSLSGIAIDNDPSGKAQSGSKANVWQ